MICRTSLRVRIPAITTFSSNSLLTLTRFTSSLSDSSGGGGGGSKVYQKSLKFARPGTVKGFDRRLWNSVSLIGTVEYPAKQSTTNDATIHASTLLLVKPSPLSHRHFRVMLCMRDLLAEIALLHLKQNDYIFVSGQLGSYTKSTLDGAKRMYYQVKVNELNYVQVPNENYLVATKSGSEADIRESGEQTYRERLHLWQLLFANPDEWYDCRETKGNPMQPDFKHKSTGEALWLNKEDPPWVKKQVELLDSRLTGRQSDDSLFGSSASEWVSDNQLPRSDSMESSIFSDDFYDK